MPPPALEDCDVYGVTWACTHNAVCLFSIQLSVAAQAALLTETFLTPHSELGLSVTHHAIFLSTQLNRI